MRKLLPLLLLMILLVTACPEQDISIEDIRFEQETITLQLGESAVLSVVIIPENATGGNLFWTSNNTEVVIVDIDGRITAMSLGSAEITVQTEDGDYTDLCYITVNPIPVEGISLSSENIEIDDGESRELTVTFNPINATNSNCSIVSANPLIATVESTEEGFLILGVNPGTTDITVTSVDGGKTAVCHVTVNPVPVTDITLNESTLNLNKGEGFNLEATPTPLNASNTNVIWTSSDPSIVSVSASGWLNGLENGTATITAAAEGNVGITAECVATVTTGVNGVSLDEYSISLVPGESRQLTATVSPGDATNKNITWSSDYPETVSVNSEGLVFAHTEGTALITVYTEDGGFSDSCTAISGTLDLAPGQTSISNTITGERTGAPGDLIEVTTLLHNQGSNIVQEPELDIIYYISSDPLMEESNTILANVVESINITADGFHSAEHTLEVPDLDPGIYYIGCLIDANDEVTEFNENNNTSEPRYTAALNLTDDQTLSDGAFKLVNSWGVGFSGENRDDGHYWLDYESAKSLRLGIRYYYNNYSTEYSPTILALFEAQHEDRTDCHILIGIGDPDNPLIEKDFQSTVGMPSSSTVHPLPQNTMALDISEFSPYINDNNVYLKTENSSSAAGTLSYFSIEFYFDFDAPPIKELSGESGEIPAGTTTVFTADSTDFLSPEELMMITPVERSIFYGIRFNEEYPAKNELANDMELIGIYEEGRNYNEIVGGLHGTGSAPPTIEEWQSSKKLRSVSTALDRGLLPDSIDNSATPWFPPIGNQGQEGSCTAFSFAYYIQSYTEARERGWVINDSGWSDDFPGEPLSNKNRIMSPDFLYHQINSGEDQGSTGSAAAGLITRMGGCTWENMPYDTEDSTTWPNEAAFRESGRFRGREVVSTYSYDYSSTGYFILETDDDIRLLKTLLASGYCLNTSINASESDGIYNLFDVHDLISGYNNGPMTTNHANTIVGYKEGSAWNSNNPDG